MNEDRFSATKEWIAGKPAEAIEALVGLYFLVSTSELLPGPFAEIQADLPANVVVEIETFISDERKPNG